MCVCVCVCVCVLCCEPVMFIRGVEGLLDSRALLDQKELRYV